jgi:hypothetical protein
VGIACLPLLRNPKQNKGSLRSVRAEREREGESDRTKERDKVTDNSKRKA